jgi:hypothetical protein
MIKLGRASEVTHENQLHTQALDGKIVNTGCTPVGNPDQLARAAEVGNGIRTCDQF